MAPVRAAGCTGSRARRLGWLLSLTALGLFALYVASNSALAALPVFVTLVALFALWPGQVKKRVALLEQPSWWAASPALTAATNKPGWVGPAHHRAGDMRDRRAKQGQAPGPPRWRRSAGAGAYSWVTT